MYLEKTKRLIYLKQREHKIDFRKQQLLFTDTTKTRTYLHKYLMNFEGGQFILGDNLSLRN